MRRVGVPRITLDHAAGLGQYFLSIRLLAAEPSRNTASGKAPACASNLVAQRFASTNHFDSRKSIRASSFQGSCARIEPE